MGDILQPHTLQFLEALIQLMMLVFSVVGTIAVSFLPGKWKRDGEASKQIAEDKLREGLHSAAVTGVITGAAQGLTGTALMNFALKHMLKSVPETIVKLSPTAQEIFQSPSVDEMLRKLPPKLRDTLENIITRYAFQYLPGQGQLPV